MDANNSETEKENLCHHFNNTSKQILTQTINTKRDSQLQIEKEQFESELRNPTSHPLDVWLSYINWTERHFKNEGKKLTRLIQRCLQDNNKHKEYFNDPRFLEIWLKLVESKQCLTDIYEFMEKNGIGNMHARFYLHWAQTKEAQHMYKEARAIYQKALDKQAQPTEDIFRAQSRLEQQLTWEKVLPSPHPRGSKETKTKPTQHLSEAPRKLEVRIPTESDPFKKPLGPVSRSSNMPKFHLQRDPFTQVLLSEEEFENVPRVLFEHFDDRKIAAPTDQMYVGQEEFSFEELKARQYWARIQRQRTSEPLHDSSTATNTNLKEAEEESQRRALQELKIKQEIQRKVEEEVKKRMEELHLENPKEVVGIGEGDPKTTENQKVLVKEEKSFRHATNVTLQNVSKNPHESVITYLQEVDDTQQVMDNFWNGSLHPQFGSLTESHVDSQGPTETLPKDFSVYQDPTDHILPPHQRPQVQTALGERALPTEDFTVYQDPTDHILPPHQRPQVQAALGERPMPSKDFTIYQDPTSHLPPQQIQLSERPLPSEDFTIYQDPTNCLPLPHPLLSHHQHLQNDNQENKIPPKQIEAPEAEDTTRRGGDTTKLIAMRRGEIAELPQSADSFACHAKMASTPLVHGGAETPRLEVLMDDCTIKHLNLRPTPLFPGRSSTYKCELSAILEGSNEAYTSSATSGSSSSSLDTRTQKVLPPSTILEGSNEAYSSSATSGSSHSSLDTCTQKLMTPGAMNGQVFEGDPFAKSHLEGLLAPLLGDLSNNPDFHTVQARLPSLTPAAAAKIGETSYTIIKRLGSGAYAKVFAAHPVGQPDTKVALKRISETHLWEFYINTQLKKRLIDCRKSPVLLSTVTEVHRYNNGQILVSDFHCYGTLLDLANTLSLEFENLPEALVMSFTLELLRILQQLHACGILHADIKPDNILLSKLPDPKSAVDPEVSSESLLLLDYGRAIDLRLYPPGTMFRHVVKTQGFQCPEMLEGQPWSHHIDYYGIAACIHVLLFRDYMKISKSPTGIWGPTRKIKRYWNKSLWEGLFRDLLNSRERALDLGGHVRALQTQLRNNKDTLVSFQAKLFKALK